jgi:Ni/Fe-hydrogenase b-type cytochrome subunit
MIPLSQINIWIDFIFFSLLALVILGMYIGHLTGNIIVGRAKKRFVKWEWPAHEHPAPFATRFMHLTHVLGMITLGLTGLYIRFPFPIVIGNRLTIKYIHYLAAVIVTVNFIARIWYAFFSKHRDYKEFALTRKDLRVLLPTVMYYGFMAPSKPHIAKYNPMQKATYGYMFPTLLFFQILTGFSLIFYSYLLAPIAPLVGGVAIARVYVRLVHYVINWLLILITMAHVYLSLTEDLPAFLHFFFGIEPAHEEPAHEEHVEVERRPEELAAPAVKAEPALHVEAEKETVAKSGKRVRRKQVVESEGELKRLAEEIAAYRKLIGQMETEVSKESFKELKDSLSDLGKKISELEKRIESSEGEVEG